MQFAKISNAYEILGNDEAKNEFDRSQHAHSPFSKMPRRDDYDDFFHHTHFHDPFSVFESVFREEFGGDFFGRGSHRGNGMRGGIARRSVFDDPFFSGGGGFGDPFGSSMFGNDPFFGGGTMGGGGPSFGGGSIFSAMNQQMNDMMNMHRQMAQQQNPSLPQNGQNNQQTFVYSSNSSRSLGGSGQESVSTSTTTRIINGKRQTVTERIITKPDGSVERHVDTSGDDDFRQVENGRGQRQALDWQPQQQQLEEEKETKPRRRFFGRKKASDNKRKRRDSKTEQEG